MMFTNSFNSAISKLCSKSSFYLFKSFYFIGLFFAISAVFIFGEQCYGWLKEGHWTQHPIRILFLEADISLSWMAQIEWQGIKKILYWFFDQSSVLFLVILGIFIAILGSIFNGSDD